MVTYAGCVPDSVSLRFEFSFMNGASFEPCSDHFGRVSVVAFQIRFHGVSFGFMNGSSFELCSDHFGRVCYVVVFQIRFHEESAERAWSGSKLLGLSIHHETDQQRSRTTFRNGLKVGSEWLGDSG